MANLKNIIFYKNNLFLRHVVIYLLQVIMIDKKAENFCYVVVGKIKDYQANEILPFFVKQDLKRITNEKVVCQKKAAYGLLHYALLKFLNFNDDFSRITKTKNGKPICENYHFSISHSGDLVAVALSSDNVGIDIENTNKKFNFERLKKVMLHESEKGITITSPQDLIGLWVKKEAKFKFDGEKTFFPNQIVTARLVHHTKQFEFNGQVYFVCAITKETNIKWDFKV